MEVDIGIPLMAICAVLIALVFDDQLVCQIDQVDAAYRPLIVADDQVAFRVGRPARTRQRRSQGSRGESTRSRTSVMAARAATTPRLRPSDARSR
jgi:hypothetical protein